MATFLVLLVLSIITIIAAWLIKLLRYKFIQVTFIEFLIAVAFGFYVFSSKQEAYWWILPIVWFLASIAPWVFLYILVGIDSLVEKEIY
ncbi:hypothetical protein A2W13_03130 [Candidatus Woesebacteria bacterium RBG_16_36_11]|uniref:Uncharacterized protein n=3 Tax=Candidatus Woeseibacteriota TaxID=1752722 RepID=A0A1F7XBQ7_9BACT|nr:MAG: hypothetical protein A2Z67_00210 [Candidatus Woesebacteria bacterium RBG_13_36_22]OGM12451.1 MAG: hypothetical protein A2W13_03130 [Candidatus Woesebacteria bacterium RBG_16_36_11]OGM15630.1 MAG: hypothetical protein A2V55_02035 [Candidatus Woesebacteria bacterium RBG_19FT_COMBO_37_29]